MRYDAVFFDLDGTLLDTLGDLSSAVNHVLEKRGFPTRTKEEVRSFIGDGFAMLIRRACPPYAEEKDLETAFDDFSEYYSAHIADTTVPYEGICGLVKRLYESGIKMAVVSNKRDAAVKYLVDRFFGGHIKIALGERGGNTRKPSPTLCLEAASEAGVSCGKTLYIGDSPSDITTALNAGMIPVAVTWGFRTKEELLKGGQVLVAENAKQLEEIIFG
ncbi:MAG: HAD family hydrolase [Clostridia bacterium]|nr:HAD family hydrolase [Clostridia bacterium]MBO7246310.1 HAD family hydrolase [Clostridia bacterium]MBO7738325.1 HAD family hydrolase [Clostridia bacterium]